MSFQTLSIVLISVTLAALGQVSMKFGMSRPGVQAALGGTDLTQITWSIATSPAVIGGISLYVVSQAYPLASLGFLVTAVFAYLFLGESLGASRIIGTVLVLSGVYLVARS
jgi:drug/metabolite transporter (DMT)-like permease